MLHTFAPTKPTLPAKYAVLPSSAMSLTNLFDDEALDVDASRPHIYHLQRIENAENDDGTGFIDDSAREVVDTSLHQILDNREDRLRDEQENAALVGHRPESVSDTVTIEAALTAIHDNYLLPCSVVVKPFIAAGTFLAGYVVESTGSRDNGPSGDTRSTVLTSNRPMHSSKKQKTNPKSPWHALFIANDRSMVKVWCRSHAHSAPMRASSV